MRIFRVWNRKPNHVAVSSVSHIHRCCTADVKRRRAPLRAPSLKSDVYITTAQRPQATVRRARALLFDDNLTEITLHGLGAAVERAVDAARALSEQYGTHLAVHTRTSSVELIDDYEPLRDDLEVRSVSRFSTAIHIRIVKRLSFAVQALPPPKRHFKRAPRALLLPVPLALQPQSVQAAPRKTK